MDKETTDLEGKIVKLGEFEGQENKAFYLSCLISIIGVTLIGTKFYLFPFFVPLINIFAYLVFFKFIQSFERYSFQKTFSLGILSTLGFLLISAYEVFFILNHNIIPKIGHPLIWLFATVIISFSLLAIPLMKALHRNFENTSHKKIALKSYKIFIETVGLMAVILVFIFVIEGLNIDSTENWDLVVKFFIFPVTTWLGSMKLHYEHLKE